MKKKDFIIYFIILSLFIFSLLLSFYSGDKGNLVRVYVDRKIYAEYPITSEIEVNIKGSDGIELKMNITDEKIYISDSNCPDKVCEKSGNINETNESIICLPGKIVISVFSDNESKYDSISR